MVTVLQFVPEVVIVISSGSVLQVVVQPAVLVGCRHRLHYHPLLALLPSALQSQLPRLEGNAELVKSVRPEALVEFLTRALSFCAALQ